MSSWCCFRLQTEIFSVSAAARAQAQLHSSSRRLSYLRTALGWFLCLRAAGFGFGVVGCSPGQHRISRWVAKSKDACIVEKCKPVLMSGSFQDGLRHLLVIVEWLWR